MVTSQLKTEFYKYKITERRGDTYKIKAKVN